MKLFIKAEKSTWALVTANNEKLLHERYLQEASASIYWSAIVAIAFISCIGVGFKCGRAAADFINEIRPRKKKSEPDRDTYCKQHISPQVKFAIFDQRYVIPTYNDTGSNNYYGAPRNVQFTLKYTPKW